MHPVSPRRSRRVIGAVLAAAVVLVLSGCSESVQRGWLPGDSAQEVTNHTGRVVSLWVGSWIAALAVGAITWGLILWCVAVYRKRKNDDVLPVQLRYHVPLEIMYTLIPVVMVGVLFYYTNRDTMALQDTSAEPDVSIQVIGKQWSWDFNYLDDDVYETGQQAWDIGGDPAALDEQVTLYLPVDKNVEFTVDSRDVIHSFWIPDFLYKMDMIPGHTNTFQVTPTREGLYRGKCAELCGEEHSSMLFNVAVVSQEEYDAQMDALRERGQTGALGMEYSRQQRVDDVAEGEH